MLHARDSSGTREKFACSIQRGANGVAGRCTSSEPRHIRAVARLAPFDHPLFADDGAALFPRQHQTAALGRAPGDNDRAAFDRAAKAGGCTVIGPDIKLTAVARPGTYDPDVKIRLVGDAPGGEAGLPRGRVWTLKSMVRN